MLNRLNNGIDPLFSARVCAMAQQTINVVASVVQNFEET
jgi:hypothetical protein